MRIFWTKRALKSYLDIEEYIQKEFGQKISEKFKDRIIAFLELLSKYPKIGTLEIPNKKIYAFQVSKQTRLFYRINKKHISLLMFFDSRRDPAKIPV